MGVGIEKRMIPFAILKAVITSQTGMCCASELILANPEPSECFLKIEGTI